MGVFACVYLKYVIPFSHMKKYTMFLSIFILSLILSASNVNVASAANCAKGELFNSSTGQACKTVTTTVAGCNAGYLFSATTGESCNSTSSTNFAPTNSTITLTSPNGGENWAQGTTQLIKWADTNDISTHEIKLVSSNASYTIANTQGSSYNWVVGQTWESSNVPTGAYTIKVCQSSSTNCDSSNGPFNITSGQPAFLIATVSAPKTTYNPGERIAVSFYGKEPDQTYATPDEGFWSQAYIYDSGRTTQYDGGNATFDKTTSKWSVSLFAPSDTTKTYIFELSLYCGLDDSLCAKRYGIGAQLDKVFNFSLNSIQTSSTPTINSILPDGCTSNTGYSSTNGLPCTSIRAGDTFSITGANFNRYNYANTYSSLTGELVSMETRFSSSSLLYAVAPSNVGFGPHGILLKHRLDNNFISNDVSTNIITGTPTSTQTITPTTKTTNISTSVTSEKVLGAESIKFTQKLKLGSSGNEVIELQKFLNAVLGASGVNYNLKTDGKFGSKTEASVIKFQSANGLTADGVVGAMTRAILNK